jgi:hypothetical protein
MHIYYVGGQPFTKLDRQQVTSVYVDPATVANLPYAAFLNCKVLVHIDIPSPPQSTLVAAATDDVLPRRTRIVIPERTFWCCESLASVQLPPQVTNIEQDAFYGCKSLTNIDIPKYVTYIGPNAFSYCQSLCHINIPHGVTKIDVCTFLECSSLIYIDIPDSVEEVDYSAFCQCKALKTLIFPKKLKYIGERAFYACESLHHIHLSKDAPLVEIVQVWNTLTFQGVLWKLETWLLQDVHG